MYVEAVPNRSSPPAILLREGWRENGRVRKRTLANLSHWPPEQIDRLRRVLKGELLVAPHQAFELVRSLPHGHVAAVGRAFRSLKTVDLKVRPIYHRTAERVRAHVFLCMPGYYVEWRMRKLLAPLLFDDDDKEAARARRKSIVAPAQRSVAAERKAARKRTEEGWPAHSLQTLTAPTPLQRRAFALLQVPCR